HLVARVRQRRDVAPPDALGLGVAVQQHQRIAANTFVDKRQRQPVAAVARWNLPSVDRERIRGRGGRLRRAQAGVVEHVVYFSNAFGSTSRWADTSPIIWISTLRSVKYHPSSSR